MRTLLWPLIITISVILVLLGMDGIIGDPFRPIITFWFFLVCPGMAFVRLLRLENTITEAVLALALSITIDMLVSVILVLNRVYTPWFGLAIIATLSVIGAILQLVVPNARGLRG